MIEKKKEKKSCRMFMKMTVNNTDKDDMINSLIIQEKDIHFFLFLCILIFLREKKVK